MIKVIALFRELLVGWLENLDYEEEYCESFIDHLYVVDIESRQKYRIDLSISEQPCGSGYCMSSYGYMDISPINYVGPFNYIPKNRDSALINARISYDNDYKDYKWIQDDEPTDCPWLEIDNQFFCFDYDGKDSYYPSGTACAYIEEFEMLPRAMKNRPVWIFYGRSGLGKSTLAMLIGSSKTIFETDSIDGDTLPDEIVADIIVLGNRHGFTRRDVVSKLVGDPMVIDVEFRERDISAFDIERREKYVR